MNAAIAGDRAITAVRPETPDEHPEVELEMPREEASRARHVVVGAGRAIQVGIFHVLVLVALESRYSNHLHIAFEGYDRPGP
jgi:hypothetical protein